MKLSRTGLLLLQESVVRVVCVGGGEEKTTEKQWST